MKGPILIAGEESQTICKAFRKAGYKAYSCDLLPTRGNPKWHYEADMLDIIPTRKWGLIILHPDCSAMAVSGNRWYGKGMPRHLERLKQVRWTLNVWELAKLHSKRVALENPVSVIFTELKKQVTVQYIQPHDHGHGETKKTGFALFNLDPLGPSNKVDGRQNRVWKMAPGPNRKRDRSETFVGVADAIVKQWGW